MLRPLLLILALALAGCATPPGDDSGANNSTGNTPGSMATLPAPIEDTKQVTGSADPVALVEPPCSSPSSQCFRYPFTLNMTGSIDASLSWTVPASDFDLYIFVGGTATDDLQGASPPGPGTSESWTGELGAGEYELVVVAWAVTQDTYTLSATFS